MARYWMGATGDFRHIPESAWPAVVPAIRDVGVAVAEGVEFRPGCWSYLCAAGAVEFELLYAAGDPGRELMLHGSVLELYRRPIAVPRVARRIMAAIDAAGGQPERSTAAGGG